MVWEGVEVEGAMSGGGGWVKLEHSWNLFRVDDDDDSCFYIVLFSAL